MKKSTNHKPLSNLFPVILPGLYLVLVLVADYFTPIGTITPFGVVIGLMVMSIVMRPRIMIPWTVVYVATVCAIFLIPSLYDTFTRRVLQDHYVIHIVRASTYVLVGVANCYVCILLRRLRRSEAEMDLILSRIPWPLLTSDSDGRIVYWNNACESLIPVLKEDVVQSYFELLAPPNQQGKTISDYLRSFEEAVVLEPIEISINCRKYKGYTERIDWTGKNILLTIIMEWGSHAPPRIRLDS